MIDHVSLRVQDFARALAFYREALAPIGYDVIMDFGNAAGLGAGGKPDLWIMATDQPLHPTHLAFTSKRDRVDAFHGAALAAGGTDNGEPGVRADYHPHYYAAFVRDPEGNNIEVVCHEDPAAPPPAAKVRTLKAAGSARRPAKAAGKKPAKKKAPAKKSAKAKPARRPAKKKRR
jgi:catechol 2,3-dioxygenase-like lactoylglutathione lyase family enzyme